MAATGPIDQPRREAAMVLKYWCARCDQKLFAAQDRAGRRARCAACGYVQAIPQPTSDLPEDPFAEVEQSGPEASVYELAGPPVERPEPRMTQFLGERHVLRELGAESPGALLRAVALEASRLQGPSLCLVALSAADLFVTFTLLRTSHAYYESNPVAQWFFLRWNMAGLAIFKFTVIGVVIALGEIIERRRPGWGRFVLMVGCAAAAAVVWHGLRLFLGAGGAPAGGD
jgi:DNA-directed RNA polymerase subunit RPC12/RpoP